MDIYAPPGGRCNKREEDGGEQTCCAWLRDSDLRGLGWNFSLNNCPWQERVTKRVLAVFLVVTWCKIWFFLSIGALGCIKNMYFMLKKKTNKKISGFAFWSFTFFCQMVLQWNHNTVSTSVIMEREKQKKKTFEIEKSLLTLLKPKKRKWHWPCVIAFDCKCF